MMGRPPTFLALAAACCGLFAFAAAGADDFEAQQQAAIRAAVDRAAPAVVRIETIGGLEKVDEMLIGTGPTTGLIVDPSGYIVSSAFNFIHKPASILVRLADGTRKPAKLAATDRSRMLVLLKIDADAPLPTCEVVPRSQMRVGEWTIAVGRTFESDRVNTTVGILSALSRISGKAIQTDAAISPNNYGGPLVDIQGRVLGVLVPLAPQGSDEVAGSDWYDSGIGFAIPVEDIERALPRLKKGEDLYPGLAGIGLKGPNLYTSEPIIAACRPKCPATAAGLKADDKIVEIDGRTFRRAMEVKDELGRRYAGDKVKIVVLRREQRIEREVELAAKIEAFEHGFLGILPMRTGDDKGVTVRYVVPESPAAKAGIAAGDLLVSLQGEPIQNRLDLVQKTGAFEPAAEVQLELRRAGELRKLKVALARLPEDLPPKDLPSATGKAVAGEAERPAIGAVPLKVPEFPNEVWAYVPEAYRPDVPYGVVVWLHGAGGFKWPELLARWKPLCDRHDLILVAPKATDPAHWNSGELALVDRLLTEVTGTYNVDPTRVVVHGYEGGGSLAFVAGFRNPEGIRAIAAVEAAPMGSPPENEPSRRMAIYLGMAAKSPHARRIEAAATEMRTMKIPVAVKKLGDVPRYLNREELAELARWIDALDRI
jgi:serine protease Do